MRIGQGYDVHRLVPDRPLIIGGAKIPYRAGLLGHSDADVLLHAVIDSIFGAAAMGDIGSHFPDSDDRYKGASSLMLLKNCGEQLRDMGFRIINIDSTIIAQSPKMAPYIPVMRENIAEALNIDISAVSVKAKTEEGMGFTGAGEGIAAQSVCLIMEI